MSFGTEIYNFITDSKNKDLIDIDDYGNATFHGKISLSENDELNINFLHLDFTPDYQEYSYNSNEHSLNIIGSSPKMSGKYSIKITT